MAGKLSVPTSVASMRVVGFAQRTDKSFLQMNRAAQVVRPRVNIPKTVTLMKMHPRRRAEAKDRRPKSLKSKMETTRSSDAYVASTKRKKNPKES